MILFTSSKVNMMSKKAVPNLRYQEFSDDWVNQHLGQLATIIRGSSPRPIKDPKWFDENSDVGWLRISDVTEQKGQIHHLNQHLSVLGQQKTHVVTTPHLLLSIAASVGYPVLTYLPTGIHDGFVIFREPKFNLNFMFFWFEQYRPQWKRYEQTGSQINLNSKIVAHTKIYLPGQTEQKMIAQQFLKIDKIIKIEEDNLAKLHLIKKKLLTKMFAQENGTEPNLRFSEFNKNWQAHVLGDFGKVVMNKRIFKRQTSPTGEVPFYKIGTFGKKADAYISRDLFLEYKEKYPYPEKGDLLISAAGSIGRVIEYDGRDAYFQDSNIVWLAHDGRILNKFLKPAYQVIHWNGIEGSTIKRLYNKNILSTPIKVPEKDEQEKIGKLFDKVEKLIHLQEVRVGKFKDFKQFCFQKMFV